MDRTEIPLTEETQRLWQRKDMVVALLHEGCAECAELRARMEQRPGALGDPELGIVWKTTSKVNGAEAFSRAAGLEPGEAALVVADRFAELFTVLQVHGVPASKTLAELLDWVEAVQRQCGECSRME